KVDGQDSLVETTILSQPGPVLYAKDRDQKGEAILRRVLARLEAYHTGEDNPFAAVITLWLWITLYAQSRFQEAMGVFEEVLGVVEKLWGPDDTTMVAALERMGLMFYSRGRYLEAEKLFRRVFYTRKKKLGKAKCTIQAAYNLGAVLIAQEKQTEEVVEVFLYALDGLRKARWLGDSPRKFLVEDSLANILLTLKMYEEAEKVLKDNLEDRKRVLGEVYRTFKVAQNLGFALLQQEKLEEAEDFFRYALEGQERVLRAGRLQTNRSAFLLGVSLQTQKRSYEAEPHLRRALVVMKGLNGDEESEVLACVSWLRKS
ncbi:hypothetical protein FPQ18DRAFT_411051, partial [Pyronema domesticum]